MKRRSPRALLILFLLVLVGVILGTRQAEPLQRLRLADGSLLTLETITYGTEHRFIPGNGFQQLAANLTPTAWHRALGIDVHTRDFPAPTSVLWFTRRGSVQDLYRTRIAFVDNHGCELDRTGDINFDGQGFSLALRNYPRRQPSLNLRIFEGFGGTGRLGEFRLRTPRQVDPPIIPPEPLPQLVRTEDFDCSLTRFVTAGAEGKAALEGDIRLSVKVKDRSGGGWEPVEFTASDALGNEAATGRRISGVQPGGVRELNLWHNLCVAEPWTIRVDFARSRNFEANGVWELNGVPLPATGSSDIPAEMRPDGSIGGTVPSTHATFAAEATRAGMWLETDGIRWDPLDGYAVSISTWGPLRGWWLSPLQATDERGRVVTLEPLFTPSARFDAATLPGLHRQDWERRLGRPAGSGDGITHWDYRLKTSPRAKRLNLRFAVHPTRSVEFRARPSRPAGK